MVDQRRIYPTTAALEQNFENFLEELCQNYHRLSVEVGAQLDLKGCLQKIT